MSIDPTDLHGQADAMRVIAELQDRAYNFGARVTPSWRFSPSGSAGGSVYTDEVPKARETDAWRLAIGTAVTVAPIPFTRESDGTLMVADSMSATYRGLRIEIDMVYPRALTETVTA